MSNLGRWIILGIALGIFPIGVKLALRMAEQADTRDVYVNSSDILALAMVLSITTVADCLKSKELRLLDGGRLQEIGIYIVGGMAVISAVWYGVQEANLLASAAESNFRRNSWKASLVFTSQVMWLCFSIERMIERAERRILGRTMPAQPNVMGATATKQQAQRRP